eukprot:NODE_176_length_15869_cov_0.275777.p6 type:complete len:342 gc:universal NODE_176_length_15869_cov_0.275777:6359-5334(-)
MWIVCLLATAFLTDLESIRISPEKSDFYMHKITDENDVIIPNCYGMAHKNWRQETWTDTTNGGVSVDPDARIAAGWFFFDYDKNRNFIIFPDHLKGMLMLRCLKEGYFNFKADSLFAGIKMELLTDKYPENYHFPMEELIVYAYEIDIENQFERYTEIENLWKLDFRNAILDFHVRMDKVEETRNNEWFPEQYNYYDLLKTLDEQKSFSDIFILKSHSCKFCEITDLFIRNHYYGLNEDGWKVKNYEPQPSVYNIFRPNASKCPMLLEIVLNILNPTYQPPKRQYTFDYFGVKIEENKGFSHFSVKDGILHFNPVTTEQFSIDEEMKRRDGSFRFDVARED